MYRDEIQPRMGRNAIAWYEFHVLTYDGSIKIRSQTYIPIGAYSLLLNPGLRVAGVLL